MHDAVSIVALCESDIVGDFDNLTKLKESMFLSHSKLDYGWSHSLKKNLRDLVRILFLLCEALFCAEIYLKIFLREEEKVHTRQYVDTV